MGAVRNGGGVADGCTKGARETTKAPKKITHVTHASTLRLSTYGVGFLSRG